MRIVLTVHQFLPEYSSGTEILTYETARELRKRGHAVSIVTAAPTQNQLADADRFDSYTYDDFVVERFNFNNKPMGDQSNLTEMEYNNHFAGAYFKQYLEREKPDVVHFFHLARLSASLIDACFESGVPTVLTPTDFWFMCPTIELRLPGNFLCAGPDKLGINCVRHIVAKGRSPRANSIVKKIPDWLLSIFIILLRKRGDLDRKYSPPVRAVSERQGFLQKRINRIDKVVVPTQIMLSKLTQNGLDAQRVVPLPFGLNLQYLENARRPVPDQVLRIGYIGTFSEHKGLHVLVQAVRELADAPIELKIYGKLNELSPYLARIRKLVGDDPRIKLCGTFPNPEIGSIFSGLDVLVVPSLWHENSPLVIYSAQYAKCPVIASNMAGMSEIIKHNQNGLLFEAGNVSELAASIQMVLKDRVLLQRFSENAMVPLSIQAYVEKLIEMYQDLNQKVPA